MKFRSVLLACALLVSACSGGDAQDSTSTSTSQAVVDTTSTTSPVTTAVPTSTTIATTTVAPTTTAEPTTTTKGTTVPPTTTIATDVDWRDVVQALGQRRQELYTNPDVGRIGEACPDHLVGVGQFGHPTGGELRHQHDRVADIVFV